MSISDIVTLALNSGTAIVVIAYFMWKDAKFMERIDKSLAVLEETTDALKKLIEKEEE